MRTYQIIQEANEYVTDLAGRPAVTAAAVGARRGAVAQCLAGGHHPGRAWAADRRCPRSVCRGPRRSPAGRRADRCAAVAVLDRRRGTDGVWHQAVVAPVNERRRSKLRVVASRECHIQTTRFDAIRVFAPRGWRESVQPKHVDCRAVPSGHRHPSQRVPIAVACVFVLRAQPGHASVEPDRHAAGSGWPRAEVAHLDRTAARWQVGPA